MRKKLLLLIEVINCYKAIEFEEVMSRTRGVLSKDYFVVTKSELSKTSPSHLMIIKVSV